MRSVLIAVALLLNACASTEELVEAADKECKSWGARPGSDNYVKCRAMISERQARQSQAAAKALSDGMQAQADRYARQAQQPIYAPTSSLPKTTTCRANGQYITCW